MANIFYRNRGTKSAPNWQYRFYGANIDGKRKEISKSGFKTKALAIEAGTAAYDEYLNGGCQIPSDKSALKMSYSDFLDFWMEEYVKINLKDTTYAGYAKKIRLYIKPNIGQYTIGSLSPASLQTFINNLFNTGLSRNTLSVIKGIVSKSLNYATVTMSILKFNPMDCVKLPSPRAKAKTPTAKKERRPVTPDEWNKIMERFPVGHPAHIPLVIAYRCGLRLGEVFALMWEDVDFTNHMLRIERQVQNDKNGWYFAPPKYDSYRTIAVDDFTLHMLKEEKVKQAKAKKYYGEYYKQLYISGFVKEPKRYVINGSLTYDATDKPVHMIMSRENGEYIQQRIIQHVGRVIHGKNNKHAVPISADWDFHSLRHTHATMLLEAGVPLSVIQDRLGHTNIEMTEEYTNHVTDKMLEELPDVLNKII